MKYDAYSHGFVYQRAVLPSDIEGMQYLECDDLIQFALESSVLIRRLFPCFS